MSNETLQREIRKVIAETSERPNIYGEYHPSQISGCPLKVFLNWMTDNETTLNCYLFQGEAVHYYLQQTGMLTEALHQAGYHIVDTEFEVRQRKQIDDEITIVGRCDVLGEKDGTRAVYDIKYSSIPVDSGHGRVYKYFSQANIYSFMFGAEEYGLIMINSRSDDIVNDIHVLEGTKSEENWEKVKQKARMIHESLDVFGYTDGKRWKPEELKESDKSVWRDVMEYFDSTMCPSYEKECNYCDHSDYCPVYNGTLGGVKALIPDDA
jgi:hypothetical protein